MLGVSRWQTHIIHTCIGCVVSGVDHLPDWDSAQLIGAGLSNTTTYQATVYRLSVGSIRDKKADFPIKNCDLLFRCHFRRQTTPKMAAFQQLPSATLRHNWATHLLTRSCLRLWIRSAYILCFLRGLITRFIVAYCILMGAENGLLQYPSSWSLASAQPPWL